MSPQYENVGEAPWRRPSGEVVAPGGTFEATEREHARIQRRSNYKARLRRVDPSPVESDTFIPDWPLKMLPPKYLKLHPDGKHAELARALVTAQGEAVIDGLP